MLLRAGLFSPDLTSGWTQKLLLLHRHCLELILRIVKCVTRSDGKSDICAIYDIGDICEKAVSAVPGVPGVPNVSHGSENCRAKCVTRRNAGGPGDRTSDSCHTDMCTSPTGLGGFGDIQFVYMDAPGSDAAGVGNRSFSEAPNFASDHVLGPGKPSSGSGDVLEMPDCVSVIDTGPGKPSPESGGMLELPGLLVTFIRGPGRSPERC